jgi:hypothetical protein
MHKIFTVAAALVVAIALGGAAVADCGGNPGVISTKASATDTTQQTLIWTAAFQNDPTFFYSSYFGGTTYCGAYGGCTPVSPNLSATFWRLGAGDPAIGIGNDNGSFDLVGAGGVYFPAYASSGYYGGASLVSGWQPGTDGCIDGGNCLCMLLTDTDGDNTYYAIASAQSSATLTTVLRQPGTDGSGAYAAPIILQPVQAPQITGSTRAGTEVVLDVNVPAPGAVYNSGNTNCNCAATGYRVLTQTLARGSMPPSDRSSGWVEASGVVPIGTPTQVTTSCGATDQDVYLATELVFDSGFGTSVVSRNSSRVECGTTLADPDDKPRTPRPRLDRPSPRGQRGR